MAKAGGDIVDHLHDVVDANEAARNKAAEITKRVISENIKEVMQSANSVTEAMHTLATLVEHELTNLTTSHFRENARLARKKYGAGG